MQGPTTPRAKPAAKRANSKTKAKPKPKGAKPDSGGTPRSQSTGGHASRPARPGRSRSTRSVRGPSASAPQTPVKHGRSNSLPTMPTPTKKRPPPATPPVFGRTDSRTRATCCVELWGPLAAKQKRSASTTPMHVRPTIAGTPVREERVVQTRTIAAERRDRPSTSQQLLGLLQDAEADSRYSLEFGAAYCLKALAAGHRAGHQALTKAIFGAPPMCDIVIRKGPRGAVDNVGGVCSDVLTGIQTVIANDLAKAEVTASTTVAATEGVNVNIVSALAGGARAEAEASTTDQRPLDERLRAQRKESALNWKKQRLAVLERYTTDKDIAVNSKIMHGEDDDTEAAAKANATQQAKKRLEELDGEVSKKKDEGMSYFSQRDLLGHLEGLSTELEAAWDRGEKVKALRFVIQACKLLSVIKVPQCYPSMFILTAKVLDTFGELVYSRIYEKAVQTLGVKKLAKDFKPDDLSLDTKEMCRNWFYKIASIRELVPRVLVELALWRCNRFIKKDPNFFQTSFERFARQVRGIGDPLLAFHARFYVAHKAQEINDEFGCVFGEGGVPTKLVSCEPARLCLEDFYFCIPKISADSDTSARLEHYLKQSQLSKEEYVGLFSPMCRWVVEVIAADGPTVLGLRTLLDQCRQAGTYSIIVQHIINSFDGEVVMQELDTLLDIVRAPRDTTCSQLELLHALGEAASVAAPSSRSAKSGLLATAVSIMSDFEFPEDSEGSEGAAASYPRLTFHVKGFFSSAMAWLYYSLINLDAREASSYLTTIYDVVSSKKLHEKSSKGLEDLLFAVVELLGTDLRGLQVMFGLKSFLSLADLLVPERKRALCYLVLTRYVSHVEKERKDAERNEEEAPVPASSSILVNGLLDMCRSIHYSLSPLTPDEEVTAFSHLLVTFIRTVDYAAAPVGDFEAQLNFLTECRKSFYKSQTVITYVITLVAELIERIAAVSPIKTHSKKSGLFVKVCLVFCHTTICSVTDSVTRAKLFFACGFLALHHGFISHGDLLMEAFADELQVVPPTSLESITQPLFANIQSAVAPDNTGLSIVQLILRVFAEGEAGCTSAGGVPEKYLSNRGRMYCACLGATVALYQRNARAGVFLLDDSQDEASSLHPSNFFKLAKTIVTSIEMEVEKLQAELGRSATPPNMHKTIKKSMSTLLFGLFKALASSCELSEALRDLLEKTWRRLCSLLGPMLRDSEGGFNEDDELERVAQDARDTLDQFLTAKDKKLVELAKSLPAL